MNGGQQMTDPSTWEVLTSIGTLVGGIGALGGAWAAWRAAVTSRETSRDALEALAVAMEPAVHIDLMKQLANTAHRSRAQPGFG
jgi:hypothetical protein